MIRYMPGTILTLVVYVLPTLVALLRHRRDVGRIALGNVLLGWTGIGWLFCLGLALSDDLFSEAPVKKKQEEEEDPNILRYGNEYVKPLTELEQSGDPAIQERAGRVLKQLRLLNLNQLQLIKILSGKLNRSELTYSRYVGAGESLCQAVIGHISILVSLLRSVEALAPGYVFQRLEQLRKGTDVNASELDTILERERVISQHCEKAEILIVRNEHALTGFGKFLIGLAEINIVDGKAPVLIDQALLELEGLASRTRLYDSQPIQWSS